MTTQSVMGKADIKKLRAQIMAEFPNLNKKQMDSVLSPKVDVVVMKCSNGTIMYVPAESRYVLRSGRLKGRLRMWPASCGVLPCCCPTSI